jgi:uncharacterized protein (TIGR02246 family)
MTSDEEETNVEVVRSLYETLADRDMDEYMSRFAEDAVWIEPEGSEFGGTYRGKDTIRELLTSAFTEWWDDFEVEPEQFIDAGDTVVVIAVEKGTYTETGKRMEARSAHVYDLEDGKVTRMESFVDSALMQQAVEG